MNEEKIKKEVESEVWQQLDLPTTKRVENAIDLAIQKTSKLNDEEKRMEVNSLNYDLIKREKQIVELKAEMKTLEGNFKFVAKENEKLKRTELSDYVTLWEETKQEWIDEGKQQALSDVEKSFHKNENDNIYAITVEEFQKLKQQGDKKCQEK